LPEIKNIYCAEENLDFRILLTLNNGSVQVHGYADLPENVKAIYMPPRTTPVMQLMDQEEIRSSTSVSYAVF
jgi:hypothetical protein